MARPRIPGHRIIWLATSAVLVALGLVLFSAGLDDADKYASAIGALAAVVGLGLSLSALLRGAESAVPEDEPRPGEETSEGPRDRQETFRARVQGDLIQIQGTGGDVTITKSAPAERRRTSRRASGMTWGAALVGVALLVAGGVLILLDLPAKPRPSASRPSSTAPLSVLSSVNPIRKIRAGNFQGDFIFTRAVTELPPVPAGYLEDEQIALDWGYRNGGVDAFGTFVEVVVQGGSAKSVVLTNLFIRIHSRAAPPRANNVRVYPGADGVDGRWAEIDLDKKAPSLENMTNFSYSGERPNEPWSFPLRVSQEAVEVFYLGAHTFKYDVQWSAELHYVAGGKAGVARIDNRGKSFRTVSTANCTRYTVKDGRIVPADSSGPPAQ